MIATSGSSHIRSNHQSAAHVYIASSFPSKAPPTKQHHSLLAARAWTKSLIIHAAIVCNAAADEAAGETHASPVASSSGAIGDDGAHFRIGVDLSAVLPSCRRRREPSAALPPEAPEAPPRGERRRPHRPAPCPRAPSRRRRRFSGRAAGFAPRRRRRASAAPSAPHAVLPAVASSSFAGTGRRTGAHSSQETAEQDNRATLSRQAAVARASQSTIAFSCY